VIRFRGTRLKLRILVSKLTRQPRDVLLRHEFNLWAENDAGAAMESVHRRITEEAVRRMTLGPKDRVLELGCGDGWAARMMADRMGQESSVVGLDVSDGMVRRAREKSAHRINLRFVCASAERIPYADTYFTKILSVEAFYYFENQEAVLRELLRVLAPGGQLFLLICLYKDHPDSLLTVNEVNVPVHVRSAAEYVDMLQRGGWATVQTEEFRRGDKPGRRPDVHDRALFVTAQKPGLG